MYCEKCGNKLPEGAAFCGKCGIKTSGSVLGSQGTEKQEDFVSQIAYSKKKRNEKKIVEQGNFKTFLFVIPIIGIMLFSLISYVINVIDEIGLL